MRLLRLFLPAIIPSWRFFRAIAPSPRIEVRREGTDDWQALMPTPAHLSPGQMLMRLFWNPERSAALYLVSLSERVVEEGSAHALAELKERAARRIDGPLCLRLVFVERAGDRLTREVLLETDRFGGT